ncbi:flagellar biosynthesis anti-sigma factor FlgM [Candidatus Sumerlaeota bacterium]|nr:flagellar biosynthesis anti-sigma factor FlgM [Candidatus Sumerlaeota bacterium]
MKISGRKSVSRTGPVGAAQRGAGKPKVEPTPSIDARATDVRISDMSREIDRVRETVMDLPDVRVERVSEIKPLVDEGNYQVESKVIAKKMVDESLRESARLKKSRGK